MTVDDTAHRAQAARPAGIRSTERALAPDLARGLMLLLIVLSNTAFHLWRSAYGPAGWQPVTGGWLDHAVQFAMITVLDLRVYPLFAFLFGYGMVQLYQRQRAAGTSERTAAGILRRRSLLLVVIGLAHATLFMAGDIVGYYGVIGFALGWLFLRRSDRALNWWIVVATVQLLVLSAEPVVSALLQGDLGSLGEVTGTPAYEPYASEEGNWLTAAGTRLSTGLFVTFAAAPLSLVGGAYVVFLLGFWAARRRVLEEPSRHLPLLRRTAVLGIAIGWLGALPSALAHVGALDVPGHVQSESGVLMIVRELTGMAAGLGYVAAIALFVHWWSRRASARRASGSHRAITAVAAVGKRSLSCYLAHSVLFAPLLAAWGLGLGAHLTSSTMALFATAVWLVTVAGAYACELKGRRGPVETVLRKAMYR
ncbi:DUF418 domain-containing protein [Streptomyces sp. TRM66268-LWL]|uniref:DUF418 domain-containing protein n=1 Tax=Streptomyces polyasparticus TaxID=2767826 RepID=A0ABR7SHF3_9ACTN|nr:DUF418 domain-containing protein [Streptomyces polyasparticus]MBC9713743.1 DUF418 domain-containing protein [Streptomyces polyasparticus]